MRRFALQLERSAAGTVKNCELDGSRRLTPWDLPRGPWHGDQYCRARRQRIEARRSTAPSGRLKQEPPKGCLSGPKEPPASRPERLSAYIVMGRLASKPEAAKNSLQAS
jgi:hypothetical protein